MGLSARRYRVSFLTVICLFSSIKVVADSPGRPQPYSFESGDYVYVMFAGFNADNKDEYLKSRTDFYNKRCKNRKKITEYDKSRCDTLDAIKRYPHSGVFRKDDPSKLVWWGGRCGGASYMTSDAEYVVQMGPWAGHVDQMALRFCKRHRVIAEYAIRDLVDDESRLPRSVSHFRWRDQIRFEDKTASLFIKTLDNNEYTFDVRTGKIIKYKYIPFKVFDAHVFYKNGTHKVVHDLTSCSGMTYATLFMGNGFPVHQLQVVEPVKKEKGVELVQTGAIPFEYIKKVRFVSKADTRAVWEITTPQGESGQVMLDSSEADLCGNDVKGEKVKISVIDIESMDLGRVKSQISPTGLRTVEQRMSWDINQWDKTRRAVCEKTDPGPYKSPRDIRNIVRGYRDTKCTENSVNFVMAMEKINGWIEQQQPSRNLSNAIVHLAKFQMESGLPNQAMVLYEYLLRNYKNRNEPYIDTSLLGELLSATYQAGLFAENKKYQKLFEVSDAIRQKHREKITAKRHKENRQKIADYKKSIENISITSIKPDHKFPEDRAIVGLLKWECGDEKTTSISAADTYQSILALERKLHPENHVHVFEAAISLAECHKKKKNYAKAKKQFDKVLSLYLRMDKKDELNAENSQEINRKLLKLTVGLTQDRSEVTDAVIALNLRTIARLRKSNNEQALFHTLSGLAYNYQLVGDYAQAEKCYKERVKLSSKLGGKNADFARADLERHYKLKEQFEQKRKHK